ncbi:MAG TPA: tripartite tricarboxylate transporter substrate binding protein [Casimicrobiaceae bacterium]|nr:tripartite tricarboxylate transporter substrate binding protein [Casimicrobiaceae bacterium]
MIVLALAAASAHAAYPERAIHLIVPYPPGGLTDAVARAVAKALSDRVQQPVVVENIAGGGGNIGADKAAKSPADGYTLYIGNNATVGLNTLMYKQLAFDPMADLAPIALIAESQTVLVVNPSLPAKSVAELIALAKSKPGQLNFGSTGTGGLSHLVGELFNSGAGIRMTHIPYKGTGPALTDLLGGQIQVMFNDTALPHIQSGKLKALAVTGAKRWPQLPDVPTLAELGMPGYETYNWFGILAPAKTPAAMVTRLNRELVAVMQDPAMKAWMEARGAEAVTSTPEEFAAYIKKDLAKWARVVKEAGITAE